jgi:hypothetical protein
LYKEINKNHEQDGKLKRLNHEKEGHFFEKINLDAVATMTKEECHVLDEQVKSFMVDVDRLSKMVQEEEKVAWTWRC